jgi:hypothetical protein
MKDQKELVWFGRKRKRRKIHFFLISSSIAYANSRFVWLIWQIDRMNAEAY